jgi:hypothetical protein
VYWRTISNIKVCPNTRENIYLRQYNYTKIMWPQNGQTHVPVHHVVKIYPLREDNVPVTENGESLQQADL